MPIAPALQAVLRRRIRYPNDAALAPERLARVAQQRGLRVTDDDRRTFALPIDDHADAELLLRSLYLPGTSDARLAAAGRVIERAIGTMLAVPLRRVVLERDDRPNTSSAHQEVR